MAALQKLSKCPSFFLFANARAACEASFSTETVMQMCHGKRRCTLNASSSTFGNPCSPQSHLYLRVVYTCGNESSTEIIVLIIKELIILWGY